jgi:hypothetical protein
MNDFQQFLTAGTLGFYQSCEVTELFLCRKDDKAIFNFYTLVVFEEKPYVARNEHYITRIKASDTYSLSIMRYHLTLAETQSRYEQLSSTGTWGADKVAISQTGRLKQLPPQFVPAQSGLRLNGVLKNNFHTGSHLLEFFDEEKTHLAFLLKQESLPEFNRLCAEITSLLPLQFATNRDRVGNLLFQFPVTLLHIDSKATDTGDGIQTKITWHPSCTAPPDCFLVAEALSDGIYMGSCIQSLQQGTAPTLTIGNLDQASTIKLWRQDPNLLLYSSQSVYSFGLRLAINFQQTEPRVFTVDGQSQRIAVTSDHPTPIQPGAANYRTFISNNLYETEKKRLEQTLSFKQYNGQIPNALEDLRVLIRQKGQHGVFLWDPFLNAADILRTLYFSTHGGVPLRAIGSINATVKKVYHLRDLSIADIIADYRQQFTSPTNNNHLLNLEFRIQHDQFGWPFHDRFLIFPGHDLTRPQVYSLGISVNSYGTHHHILQEVSHPQPVVDAFLELWDQLTDTTCLVWKSPQ